jgi:hypothetical protein
VSECLVEPEYASLGVCRANAEAGAESDKAFALPVNQNRSFAEQCRRRPKYSRKKFHQKRPQDSLRQRAHRPRDNVSYNVIRRKALD